MGGYVTRPSCMWNCGFQDLDLTLLVVIQNEKRVSDTLILLETIEPEL